MSDNEEQRTGSGEGRIADDDVGPDALAATSNPMQTQDDSVGGEDEAVGHGASSSGLVTADAEDEHDEEGAESAAASKQTAEDLKDLIAGNDVKNIILQVTSPYLDDNGGLDDASDAGGEHDNLAGDDGGDAGAQRYDHIKSRMWIQLICDGIMERLVALGKPYKFIVHCMVMRKNGAGMHVCSSCLYGHNDGWVNHAHDLSTHIYAIVTVYWSAI